MSPTNQLLNRVAFGLTGAAALGTSAVLFRDLADLSQWVLETDRDDVFRTFRNRHQLAALSVASAVANSAIAFRTRCVPIPVLAAVNGTALFMLYSGYINPEIMMRPRNHNAVYVPNGKILDLIKREETVVVTQVGDSVPRAFPDSQLMRPHVVRIGTTKEGIPATMTYCALTNLAMAYETPPHDDGKAMELAPLTQLENNLVLIDKATGKVVGQQILGVNETCLLEKLGATSYQETKRRPPQAQLEEFKLHGTQMAKEVATWRMNLGNFIHTYPNGEVFVNDYRMFKELRNPIKSLYDALMDSIFEFTVYSQNTNPEPVFPTLKDIDPRLPPKEQVWAFNAGDDYVAVTERFVRDGTNGVRNLSVGGVPVVAAWDSNVSSLGIWRRPSKQPVKYAVDVHGLVNGQGAPLERVSTVKNGVFWCVWANFFPKTRFNPES